MRLVDRFDAFLLDVDGTVISGGKPAAKAVSSLRRLRKTGKPFLFVTNNARRSPGRWAGHLVKAGIAARAGQVVTSARSTALYLNRKFGDCRSKKAFVSGAPALVSEVKKTGIRIIKAGEVSAGCDIVIIGGHPEFGYADIAAASTAVRNGADFLATNSNFVYPAADGGLMPATGTFVAAIEKASGGKATITGKPSRGIFKLCLDMLGTPADATAIIGDGMKTDIKGGAEAGLKTILTLTGISSREDVKKSRRKPDYVIKDLSELFRTDF